MGLGRTGAIALRWRWFLVLGVVLAVVAGGPASASPPSYTQSASYLLLSPVVTQQGEGNPFLQLGNGVGMAAAVLAAKVNGSETAAAVGGEHPGVAYSVSPDRTTSAPILVVTAEDQAPDVVSSSLDQLGDELPEQAGHAAEGQRRTRGQLGHHQPADRRSASRRCRTATGLRMAATGAGAVLVAVLALIALLERRRYSAGLRAAPAVLAAGAPAARRPVPVPVPARASGARARPRRPDPPPWPVPARPRRTAPSGVTLVDVAPRARGCGRPRRCGPRKARRRTPGALPGWLRLYLVASSACRRSSSSARSARRGRPPACSAA